ncbi:PAS domain S-box protein [Candidatus Desantisbacteria bacterium]|nr:PAS domain S-box protein [Candidatus Desantisbacteria bacterium]
MNATIDAILEKATNYCRDNTDLVHLNTALSMAKRLIAIEGGNERVIIPAIILHDTGWQGFSYEEESAARRITVQLEEIRLRHQHELAGGVIADNILSEMNWPEKEKEKIVEIINWHDTRTISTTKEDMIVKDADKLSRYTPECFDLFCIKLGYSQREFFNILMENIEKWFYTDSAKYIAREYLLKRRIGVSTVFPSLPMGEGWGEGSTEFEKGLSGKLYELLIRLEGEVVKNVRTNLEGLAISTVKEKVYDVRRMLEIYLFNHPDALLEWLQENEEFDAMATQRVGRDGYIGIIDRKTGRIIFHPDKRVINLPCDKLHKKYRPVEFLHGFLDWHTRAQSGEEFYSYYQGMNIRAEVVDKFQYVVPLDIGDFKWSIVCAAVCDDFFGHIEVISKDIIRSVSEVSDEIGNMAQMVDEGAKRLEAERERLDVTLRSIGDGVIVADTEGRVVLLNKVAEELTGWKECDAIGQPVSEIFYIINEYTRRRCENPVQKVLETGLIVGLANHTALISKDKQERVIADSGAPINDKNGSVIGVVLVFRDTTEKKKMEEAILKTERLSAIAQIAAEAAHEIRNPLQIVNNGLYLLKKRSGIVDDDLACRNVLRMENAISRASGFIEDLLNFSKPLEIKRAMMNINQLIKEAIDDMPGTILFDVELIQSLAANLPDISADSEKLKEVVINIVKNGVESMTDSRIKRLEIQSSMDEEFVKLTIKDTGKGIPEENFKKIFDSFYTTKGKGVGLGLSICCSFVEAHGGRIAVTSKVGKGTTFTILLPHLIAQVENT